MPDRVEELVAEADFYDDDGCDKCAIVAELATIAREANARADEAEAERDWLAQRLAEYAGCPGVNGHGCVKPDGCVLPEDEATCWQATAAREAGTP